MKTIKTMDEFVDLVLNEEQAAEFKFDNNVIVETKFRGWCIEFNFEHYDGNAYVAMKRKVVRFARMIHLRAYYDRWHNWIIIPIRGGQGLAPVGKPLVIYERQEVCKDGR